MNFTGDSLKELAETSQSAKFTPQGWTLESKSRLVLNLPELTSELSLTFKRISGNGKLIINGINHMVVSKISEVILLDPTSKVEISRDEVGSVVLQEVTLNLSQDMAKNWKTILSKCSGHHSIRLTGSKLTAGEGGWLQPANIFTSIETSPPNSFVTQDDKIKFTYPCEILKLVLDPNAPPVPVLSLPSRKAPTPNLQPASASLPVSIASTPPVPQFIQPASGVMTILDTTNPSQGFRKLIPTSNKLVKIINSNNQDYLNIRKGGSVSIPIAGLTSQRTYVYSILTKRLNGNGKLTVSLTNGRQTFGSPTQLVDTHFTNKSAALQIPNLESDDFKLTLTLGDDASGEILISKLCLMDSAMPIFSLSRMPVISSVSHTLYPQESSPYSSTVSIKDLTLNSAVISVPNCQGSEALDCIIHPMTYRARNWVAKTAAYVKGVKVIDPYRQMINIERSEKDPNLVITSLGHLKGARGTRIFLEEWNSKFIPNDEDLGILRQFDTILTNSRNLMFILRSLLPEKNLHLVAKPWYRSSTPTSRQSQTVYLEKDELITRQLVDAWKPNYPKLLVVGSNLDVPEHISKISEFLDYPELVKLIANSSLFVDLSFCNNYQSGSLALASSLGCQVITNNLNELDPSFHFLNCELNPFRLDLEKLEQSVGRVTNRDVKDYPYLETLRNLIGC